MVSFGWKLRLAAERLQNWGKRRGIKAFPAPWYVWWLIVSFLKLIIIFTVHKFTSQTLDKFRESHYLLSLVLCALIYFDFTRQRKNMDGIPYSLRCAMISAGWCLLARPRPGGNFLLLQCVVISVCVYIARMTEERGILDRIRWAN